MYTKIKKRLAIVLSAICAFAVAFGLYGILTNETGAITSSAETYTDLNSESSFSSLSTGAYKLTSDITATSAITISSETSVTIDLNGYTLTVSGTSSITGKYMSLSSSATELTYAAAITNNGTLIIEDSAGGGSIVYSGSAENQVTIWNNATLNITGGTISGYYTILDVTSSTTNITGGTVTSSRYAVVEWGTLIVSGEGEIYASGNGSEWYMGIRALSPANVTINDNAKITAEGTGDSSEAGGVCYFGAVNTNNVSYIGNEGYNYTPVTITINGGTISGIITDTAKNNNKECYGISGNGLLHYSTVTINGGTITCTDGVGYYHPELGDLTITDGTIIGDYTALEIRAGSLTITGGTFTATYSGDSAGATANGNGTTVKGAAIGISQHTTNLDLTINITGGTFSGYYAVYETDTVTNSKTDNISVSLTGGTYETTNTADNATAVASTTTNSTTDGDNTTSTSVLSVTGGTYNTSISSAYLPTGLTTTTNESESTYSITVDTSEITIADGYSVLMSYDGSAVTAYASFSSALDTAKSANSISIWLCGDVTECISIPAGLTVTLDLCGYTITNKVTTTTTDGTEKTTSDHTITVASGATLTINDSGHTSGDTTVYGTVDNITHGCAAIYSKGNVALYGGTYTRSAEASTSKDDSGSNSYYTIENLGTMVINNDVTVGCYTKNEDGTDNTSDALGKYSSLIRSKNGTLTINGGTYIGGLNTVKNDEDGNLTIYGGTFTNTYQYVILNWNVATINDGTFIVSGGNTAVVCVGAEDDTTVGSITINGGTFVGTDLVITEYTKYAGYTTGTDVTINGGSFSGGAFSSGIESYSVTGGTYDSTAYNSLKSYIVNANINLVYDDSTGTYTATSYDVMLETSSGTKYLYDTDDSTALEQAISAMSTEGTYTITLGSDYTLSSALTIASDQNVTLDLNGYTLSYGSSVSTKGLIFTNSTAYTKTYYLTGIINYGTLTITDSVGTGTIESTAKGGPATNSSDSNYTNYYYYGVVFNQQGTLNIESGTLTATGNSYTYGIYNYYGTVNISDGTVEGGLYGIYNYGGTLTIEDGSISANTSSARAIYNYGQLVLVGGTLSSSFIGIQNSGTVTINGGSVSGTSYGIYNDATLIINDGEISKSDKAIINNDSLSVSGGTIIGTTSGIQNQSSGIATIINGTISGGTWGAVNISGTLIITGGNISGYYAVQAQGANTSTTITGGYISGEYVGVSVNYATIIIGEENGDDSKLIITTSTAMDSNKAIQISADGGEATAYIYSGTIGNAISEGGIGLYGYSSSTYATLYMYGGTIEATSIGIFGNGSTGQGYDRIYIYGGTISAAYGMYLPQTDGETYIYGGSITGSSTAIEIRAGSLTITDGTFISTATSFEVNGNGNGTTVVGAAIAISQHTTEKEIDVTITGGTFSGIYAVYETDTVLDEEGKQKDGGTIGATLSGGTYNGKVASTTTTTDEEGEVTSYAILISGGTYDTDVFTYAADGLTTSYDSESGTYGIVIDPEDETYNYVAYNGSTGYTDIATAISAAASGDTINVYANVMLSANVTIDNLTINLNGFAITVASGYALTISNGTVSGDIIVSENATIVINGGTINGNITADSATVEISGGTYTGTLSGTGYSITGGTFSILPDTSYFASGYCAYQQLNGTYLTVSGNFVAIPTLTTTTYVYTGSNPDLSELEGTGYAVSIDGYIVGTHAVTLTLNSGYVWSDGTIANKTLYITITAADMIVSASGYNDTYDGSAHGGSVSVTTPTDAIIKYGTEEGSYNLTTAPTYTTVGTYTVYYKITADNYNEVTGSYTITITAATMTATVTGYSGTYDGSAHGATTVTIADDATIKYGTEEGSYTMTTAPTYTTVGTYTVYYKIMADNYNDVTGSYTITIEKATYDMSDVSLDNLSVVYDGNAHSIKISGMLPTGVTVSYSGSGTTVGTYTITATFTGDSNYNDIASLTATLTITKQTVTAPAEDSTTYTYNGKAQTYGIAENALYTISGATQTNAGTYTVTVDLVDHDNYVFDSGKTMLTYTFTIAKATVDVPEASTKDYTYNGSEQTYDIAESSLYTINGATHTNAGTYTVTVALVDYDNYVWSDSTVTAHTYTFIIAKADNAISVSISGWTYGQSANAPTAMVTGESGTIVYGYSTAIDGDYTATAPTAAGTYYVIAYIAATTNYNAAYSTPVAFTIAKATYDMSGITLADLTVTYDGTARSILISGTLPEGVTVTYTGNGNTEAGTYTITAAFAGDSANYEAIASLTATLTISKAAITATAEGYSGTYDGGAHSGSIATISGATIAYGTSEGTYDLAEAPAYTSAGTYTVYYQISKENYETLTGSYTVTITAATVEVSEDNTVVGTVTSDTLTVEVTANINLVEEESYDLATETIVETVVAAIEEVESAEVVAVYDITLTTASGEGITVADATDSGKIAVTVAIPTALASKDFYIVHIHDGEIIGIITSDEYEKINGSVTFEVSSLSQFAFVETSTETTTQSSNNFETYLMIGLVVGDLIAVLLIVVVACMVIRRKRTA